MSEVLKKIALPFVVLGFYPLVKLLSETTINLSTYGPDIDVSLKVLEFLWAIILAVAMLHFYRKVMKSEE
jgi:hypothetical protein